MQVVQSEIVKSRLGMMGAAIEEMTKSSPVETAFALCGALSGAVRRIRIAILFKPSACGETQQDARRAQKAEQHRRAGAFAAAEKNMERRSGRTDRHQRLEDAVDRCAAQEQTDRDCENCNALRQA